MTMSARLLMVLAGGGMGSVLRYVLTLTMQSRVGTAFPWGTLAVNLIGCAAIGILGALFDHRYPQSELRLLLIVGLLGGFTTFSSFAYETLRLAESGRLMQAAVYVLVSNVTGIALAAIAYAVTKQLTGNPVTPS